MLGRLDLESLREVLEGDGSEEIAFRRGYQHGANEAFHAVEALLTPRQKTVMSKWIDKLGVLRRSAEELPRAPSLTKGK